MEDERAGVEVCYESIRDSFRRSIHAAITLTIASHTKFRIRSIKELKEDLSLDSFCLKSFDGTDAAFRMGCVLYNLLADFREAVLPRSWFERRLRAVRDWVFLVGADLISQGRRVQIRFAVADPDRPELLRRLRTMSEGLPIAAQLEWSVTDQTPNHPDKIVTPIPLIPPDSTVDQSP